MEIVISKDIIGFDKHLSFNGADWRWVNNPSHDSFLWGFESHRDLREAITALKIEVDFFENTPWMLSQATVVPRKKIMWSNCLPRRDWKKIVQKAATQLWSAFSLSDNSYYVSTYIRNREVIESLEQPTIDSLILSERIKASNDNLKKSLARFSPDRHGLCPKFSYSLSSSVTGRMTICNGPNVLTMKRSDRDIFKSKHANGKIVEIDISSAEPRVALSLFGKEIQGDVYEDVAGKAGVKITRSDAKIATLSALYGASHHSLKSRMSKPEDAIRVLDTVKEYFGVRLIEKMINSQYESSGFIKNTHGRKIFSNPPSLNHFIQSSSVDVSFDIFESLIEAINFEKINASPVFLIHDAIGLDIKSEDIKNLKRVCELGFYSKTLGIKLPVRVKEIG